MSVRASALAVVLVAAAAHAHDVGAELSIGGNKQTADNPRNGYAGVLLNGGWDVNDWFGLSGLVGFTHDNGTSNARQSVSGNNIFAFGVNADLMFWDHFLLIAGLQYSPSSVQKDATTLLNRDVVLVSRNSLFGGQVALAYASNGLGVYEHTFDLVAQVTRFGLNQQLVPEEQATLAAACAQLVDPGLHPIKAHACSLLGKPHVSELIQFRLALGYTATLAQNTDLGLEGAYFFYDHDPTQTSYYSVGVIGRLVTEADTPTSVAPLQWYLKPSFAHRFGEHVAVKIWVQYGQYVPGEGYDAAIGGKLSYKFDSGLKLYLLAIGQRDVDAEGNASPFGAATIGINYTW